jgi:molybdate/tungstate transport system ATP-binding protein
MIALQEAELTLGGFAIGPLDLEVQKGEHVLLVGPSGAGKSLVLELVAGFRAAKAGVVRLRGANVENVPPRHRRCGWVPQAHALFPHLTVRGNLEYGLRSVGVTPDERQSRVARIARRLELEHLLDRSTPTLSGGERQRVALGRALVLDLDILLLDEPFSSLEPGRRQRLWALVKELHSERGLTILHVTHDLAEARHMDRRTVVMVQGKVVQTGRIDEIMRAPADPQVALAFGEASPAEAFVARREGSVSA